MKALLFIKLLTRECLNHTFFLYIPDWTEYIICLPWILVLAFSALMLWAIMLIQEGCANTWALPCYSKKQCIDWSDVIILLNSQHIHIYTTLTKRENTTSSVAIGDKHFLGFCSPICFSLLNFQWLLSTFISAVKLKVISASQASVLSFYFEEIPPSCLFTIDSKSITWQNL